MTTNRLTVEYLPLDELRRYKKNPKLHCVDDLAGSVQRFGFSDILLVNEHPDANFILAGHGRCKALTKLKEERAEAPLNITTDAKGNWLVPVVKLSLPPGEAEAYLLAHNALGSKGDPDLGAWDMDMLSAVVGDMQLLDTNLEGLGWDAGELDEIALGGALKGPPGSGGGDDPPPNKADELQEKWGVKVGDLWACGEHRIVCGDCTDQAVVDLVMGGEKAALIHADPPYGMGKEKDGIANDNLYRDKLDVFQMQWWAACRAFVNDNGSAYIWGTAEDLWRLWYCGGLSESERMTMRNEIVWDKKSAGAGGISHQGAEGLRQYPTATERCLFFMLGEQGFNNNSDNYWEGWEPVRSQLEADCKKMGWGQDDIKRICGVGMYSHWFTKSQWTFIPEEHYRKLQEAAREHDDLKREHDDLKREHDAFKREHDDLKREHDDLKREHDDLKREWYATRAHFDNVHDNMTDVWEFARVTGDERQGHATPKPVEMAERAIKSSSNDGDRVLVPFMGTCPELIACERLNRRCMGIELSPAYVAVCLERWHMETGLDPELLT